MVNKREQTHITELSDIPPNPESVFGKNGHIKPSFMEKFSNEEEKNRIPIEQRMKIMAHVYNVDSGCAQCGEALRKAKGELPPGSLPFGE